VSNDHPTDLLDLIRLGLATKGLEIEDLRHAVPSENVMVATNPLSEAQMDQQGPEVVEPDVCV